MTYVEGVTAGLPNEKNKVIPRYPKWFLSDGTPVNQLVLAGKGDVVLFAATDAGSLKTFNTLEWKAMSGVSVEDAVDGSSRRALAVAVKVDTATMEAADENQMPATLYSD